jgi:hypothetical protein
MISYLHYWTIKAKDVAQNAIQKLREAVSHGHKNGWSFTTMPPIGNLNGG